MFFKPISVIRVRGSEEKIEVEEKITEILEFIPWPDGTGDLLLDIKMFIERKNELKKRGCTELKLLGKQDVYDRRIIRLGKIDVKKLLLLKVGDEIVFKRTGWGKTWNQQIQRI